MYCKYCGRLIDDDSTFCYSCGKSVTRTQAEEPAPEEHKVEYSQEEQTAASEYISERPKTLEEIYNSILEENEQTKDEEHEIDMSQQDAEGKRKNRAIAITATIICIIAAFAIFVSLTSNLSNSETSRDNAKNQATETSSAKTATKSYTLSSGTYAAGDDFYTGTYDIEVVSGSGNVYTADGDLNLIMGTEEANEDAGTDMYIQSYKNAYFNSGDTLYISGVTIKLIPSD